MSLSVFIDNTAGLKLVLLDKQWKVLKKVEDENSKNSIFLQSLIKSSIEESGYQINQIKNVICVSGPGSYTGIRLTELMLQVFEWSGVEPYSIYHFDVPKMLGINEGVWITNAFKGEFFLYKWDRSGFSNSLIKSNQFEFENGVKYFSNVASFESNKVISTWDLIVDKSEVFFPLIIKDKIRKTPFYFRSDKEDFGAKI